MEITKNDKTNKKSFDTVSNIVRRYSFERLGRFNYLGMKIIGNGEERIEI